MSVTPESTGTSRTAPLDRVASEAPALKRELIAQQSAVTQPLPFRHRAVRGARVEGTFSSSTECAVALLKLSRNDISKWLESQRIVKPLQDMTESEIQKAVETFRIPRQALLQIINATEYDTALTPVGAQKNRLEGSMQQT